MRALRGLTILAALMLGAASPPGGDRYEVILFQPGGAPALADMNPRVLPIAMITRGDAKEAIYIETDQAGLARVQDDAALPPRGPMMIYKALGPRVPATAAVKAGAASLVPGAKGAARTYYLFAHLEPAEGQEQTFNDYYDATHLPEVITVPGMQWGGQFKSYDLKATMAEVDRRLKEQITKPFPKGSVGRNLLVYYAGPAANSAK